MRENLIKIKFPRVRDFCETLFERGEEERRLKRLDRKVIKTITPQPNQNYNVSSEANRVFAVVENVADKIYVKGERAEAAIYVASLKALFESCDEIDNLFLARGRRCARDM